VGGRSHHFTFPIRIRFLIVVNFQPFELIEPIEPFEPHKLLKLHKLLKRLKPQKPLPTSSPTSSPQLNDARQQIYLQ
jgi:hypothetical protein